MQRHGMIPEDGPDAPVPPRDAEEATRGAWYCAGPSRLARTGALATLTLLGEHILVGRDREGWPFALRDRCPHRGAPLSQGSFDGGAVTCSFHGWRFSTDGTCLAMPALSAAEGVDPSSVSVATFPIKAVNGLLWNYLGRQPGGAPPFDTAYMQRLFAYGYERGRRLAFDATLDAGRSRTAPSGIEPLAGARP